MCWVCGHCIPIAPKWGLLLLLWVCLLIKYKNCSRFFSKVWTQPQFYHCRWSVVIDWGIGDNIHVCPVNGVFSCLQGKWARQQPTLWRLENKWKNKPCCSSVKVILLLFEFVPDEIKLDNLESDFLFVLIRSDSYTFTVLHQNNDKIMSSLWGAWEAKHFVIV